MKRPIDRRGCGVGVGGARPRQSASARPPLLLPLTRPLPFSIPPSRPPRYLKRRATEALAALDSSSSATSSAAGASSSSSPSLLAGVGAATPEAAEAGFARAAEELRSFERQAVVYDLYTRKDLKNVLEVDAAAAAAAGGKK
jgi:hypothetical protein